MQKTIIVSRNENGTEYGIDEVNELLEQGWHIVSCTPMGGTAYGFGYSGHGEYTNADYSNSELQFASIFVLEKQSNILEESRSVSGQFYGDVWGDMGVNINGTLNGDISGDMESNINGTLNGDIYGGMNGNINGVMNGDIQENMTGDIVGTLNGSILGDMSGNIYGTITGTIKGKFTGKIYSKDKSAIEARLN